MKNTLLTEALEEVSQEEEVLTPETEEEVVEEPSETEQIEEEITIYAKIEDFAGLEQANDKEHHVQAEIRGEDGNRVRVRKTTREGQDPVYEMTVKTNCVVENSVNALKEETFEIESALFQSFVEAAVQYVEKTRYSFKIEGIQVTDEEGTKEVDVGDLKYEVDVFTSRQGGRSEWCKIDIEVQDLPERIEQEGIEADKLKLKFNMSKLPFSPTEFIVTGDSDTPEEDKAKVAELYQAEFLLGGVDSAAEPVEGAGEEIASDEEPDSTEPVEDDQSASNELAADEEGAAEDETSDQAPDEAAGEPEKEQEE